MNTHTELVFNAAEYSVPAPDIERPLSDSNNDGGFTAEDVLPALNMHS